MLDFSSTFSLALALLFPVRSLLTTCSEDLITDFFNPIESGVCVCFVKAQRVYSQVVSARSESFHFAAVLYGDYEHGFELRLRMFFLELLFLRMEYCTSDLTALIPQLPHLYNGEYHSTS